MSWCRSRKMHQRGKDTSPSDTLSMTTASSLRPKRQENEMDALMFIWHMYFNQVNRALDLPMKLERWAIAIAHPYLSSIFPSASTTDITDSCNASMDFKNQNSWILMQKWNPKSMQITGNWLAEKGIATTQRGNKKTLPASPEHWNQSPRAPTQHT